VVAKVEDQGSRRLAVIHWVRDGVYNVKLQSAREALLSVRVVNAPRNRRFDMKVKRLLEKEERRNAKDSDNILTRDPWISQSRTPC
jgi:hypothetical protein